MIESVDTCEVYGCLGKPSPLSGICIYHERGENPAQRAHLHAYDRLRAGFWVCDCGDRVPVKPGEPDARK